MTSPTKVNSHGFADFRNRDAKAFLLALFATSVSGYTAETSARDTMNQPQISTGPTTILSPQISGAISRMRLSEHIYLVGSGRLGFNMSDELDCHVYLISDGEDAVIIDAGAGRNCGQLLDEISHDGIDHTIVRRLLLTHAHADHAGGAAALSNSLGLQVFASELAGTYLTEGDEAAISLDRSRAAGGYPADYSFARCDVSGVLVPGDRVDVGSLSIDVFDSPGHCGGHLSFALRRPGGADLFTGDAVFFGGKILLQDIWDCSVSESCRTVERLAAIRPDGLYPAHGPFSRQRGWTHLDKAMESVNRLLPPPQYG